MQIIHHKIKRTRVALGLTQRKLGDLIGLSGSEIGFLENRRRELTLVTFIDICKALKKHPMYFLHHLFPVKKTDFYITDEDGKVIKETMWALKKKFKKIKIKKK